MFWALWALLGTLGTLGNSWALLGTLGTLGHELVYRAWRVSTKQEEVLLSWLYTWRIPVLLIYAYPYPYLSM